MLRTFGELKQFCAWRLSEVPDPVKASLAAELVVAPPVESHILSELRGAGVHETILKVLSHVGMDAGFCLGGFSFGNNLMPFDSFLHDAWSTPHSEKSIAFYDEWNLEILVHSDSGLILYWDSDGKKSGHLIAEFEGLLFAALNVSAARLKPEGMSYPESKRDLLECIESRGGEREIWRKLVSASWRE